MLALLLWLAPRPTMNAPGNSADNEPATLAKAIFTSASELNQSLHEGPVEARTESRYRHAIDQYELVVRAGSDDRLSAQSLARAADLMREMGDDRGDYSCYERSIATFRKVIAEYPRSNYVGYALLAIAEICEENLQDLDGSAAAYRQIVQHFPDSVMAREARAVLTRYEGMLGNGTRPPDVVPRAGSGNGPFQDAGTAFLNNVRNFGGPDYARVVLDLSDGVKYSHARVSPTKVVVRLSGSRILPALYGRRFIIRDSGLLRRISVTEPADGVGLRSSSDSGIEVEIEVGSAGSYSAIRLSEPERLVIDIHGDVRAATGEGSSSARRLEAERIAKASAGPLKTFKTPDLKPAQGIAAAPPAAASSAAIPPLNATPGDGASTNDRAMLMGTLPLAAPGNRPMCIVIDPGHGGHDTGTIGAGGLREKDLALDVAKRLRDHIKSSHPDVEVVLTRDSDRFVALEERTAIANSKKADLFISIHANASPSRAASGVETFIVRPDKPDSSSAERPPTKTARVKKASLHREKPAATTFVQGAFAMVAADPAAAAQAAAVRTADAQTTGAQTPTESGGQNRPLVAAVSAGNRISASRELASFIQSSLVRGLGAASPKTAADRGVKHAGFVVLLGASMPSVLAEVSFMSNPRDESLLQTAEFRDKIAVSLLSGLNAYLKKRIKN
jgi:N-acetylmuramoyl-L-alanine amidase